MSKKRSPLRVKPVVLALRAEAQRRKLSIYRLHKMTDLTQQTIQRLLSGEGSPTLDTLEVVAKALRFSIQAIPDP